MTAVGLVSSLVAGMLAAGPSAPQDRMEPPPPALENVGIVEKLGAAIPLELPFKDEDGRDVRLGDYFRPDRPVILTLNYYRCPMLCTLELNGLVEGLKEIPWMPGERFELVTVSIDPREQPELARAKKRSYVAAYAKPGAEVGWQFLTGSPESVSALTEAVGFSHAYDRETDQFGHAAGIVVASPGGRISRYLYGVRFDPATLRLALVEASEGTIGTALDRIVLYCYHYDSSRGRYAPAALTVMRAGAALAVLALGAVVARLRLLERHRRRAAEPPGPGHAS